MTPTTIAFKVARASTNTNSFGLGEYVLVAQDGEAWRVLRSHYSGDKWADGQVIHVPAVVDDQGFVHLQWARESCELPAKLRRAPANVVAEVWGD